MNAIRLLNNFAGDRNFINSKDSEILHHDSIVLGDAVIFNWGVAILSDVVPY